MFWLWPLRSALFIYSRHTDMAKKPTMFSTVSRRWNRQSKRLRSIVKIAAAIGAISGAIVSTAAALPLILHQTWFVAHRGYVLEHSDPLLKRIIEVQLKQTDDDRKKLLREVQKYELELQSDQAKATPQYHSLVQKEIERVKSELNENDARHNSLFNEKLSK